MSSSPTIHERDEEDGDLERYAKRSRLDEQQSTDITTIKTPKADILTEHQHILPPSRTLLGAPLPAMRGDAPMNFLETDVGISEYVGRGVPKIEGIIKQRFTDFLVYEIDLNGNVLHIKSLDKPESPKRESIPQPAPTDKPAGEDNAIQGMGNSKAKTTVMLTLHPDVGGMDASEEVVTDQNVKGKSKENDPDEPWPKRFTVALSPFLSDDIISKVKQMYLEGPEQPRVSDKGWGSRLPRLEGALGEIPKHSQEEPETEPEKIEGGKRGGRGGRGGRGKRGGRGGRGGSGREDNRKVSSDPISSKETRTALHRAIRELFGGKFDSETEDAGAGPAADEGSRVVIKWATRGGRGAGRGRGPGRGLHTFRESFRLLFDNLTPVDNGDRPSRGTYPPYIHFTLQKTNRDTQDALGYLARTLHVNVKDLSVAGTKDKRGVTVQRVSLKRNSKTVEDVWQLTNCQNGRRSPKEAATLRGERGVRVADLNYRKASLELGMLKGNAFVITLRSVKVDSIDTLHKAMNIVKTKGFINYYGMQRFGTASVPTHAIGLALLRSDWHKAISLILQKRHGEHPDVSIARDAWLVDGDLDKALELMPRRVVAERCLLESFKKQGGDTRNAMGALSTIPRNLRLMYIHAYQSYVWNAIVSERIRTYGADKPVAGDLVFEAGSETGENMAVDGEEPPEDPDDSAEAGIERADAPRILKKSRKPYVPPRIKTLTEEDLDKYTIFDVVMPLPGTDVAYPGGPLGEKYQEYLRMDGLDPNNFERKQKDYTLSGSYRSILHLPKELSWSVLQYTDPDVALAQADEDRLLGFDPPVVVEDGKFTALQINITLGTASYATMALREVTKTETSSHFQTGLTNAAEDQRYRGYESGAVGEGEAVEEANEATSV